MPLGASTQNGDLSDDLDSYKLIDTTMLKRPAGPDTRLLKRTRTQSPPRVHVAQKVQSHISHQTNQSVLQGTHKTVQSVRTAQSVQTTAVAATADTNVSLLHNYIRACEAKINLLAKCNAVNASTSLSLDAKSQWHAARFVPKLAAIDATLARLRPSFSFLDPPPAPEDLSNVTLDVSVGPGLSVSSPPALPGLLSPLEVLEVDSNTDLGNSRNNDPADFARNTEEAHRVVMERRANGPVPSVALDLDDDDDEDNFGEGYMAGLQSSQIDEETDLSGFVANDDDVESVDGTFRNTQGTQQDSDDSVAYEVESDALPAHKPDLRDELDGIKLSQDVAARFGVRYEDIETIEVSEDEDDAQNADFTTQLNEGRDEVVEILSEDDLDEQDLDALTELLHIKTEPGTKLQVLSESDFSDDDDELIQLSKTVGTVKSPAPLNERRVPRGSEAFIDEVYDELHNTFKLPNFRLNQLEAIVSTLQGKDVFVLIPTGGGKSLCYQLPALVKGGKTSGTTVVISPLISLMQDQVQHLLAKNIRAGMISSKGTSEERNATFRELTSGQLDLVYLSPEMVNNSVRVQKVIEKLHESSMLARVVVDEAHCVSSWGHDFRPDYKGMSIFKQKFPDVPIMALTATANEKVRLDIIHNLRMTNPVLLKQSFNRTNLFYEVRNKPPNFYEWVRDYVVNNHAGSTGIIYCHSKQSCETTAQKLNEWGIKCMYYHAGMDPNERFDVQTQWQHNEIQLICATIAFGMGIDKPDVRFVIHMYIPRSLEGYYQETGRAGRDGLESECVMFYSYKDARSLQSLIQRDDKLEESAKESHLAKLRQVIQYCENKTDCRRRQVLHFFNETFDPKLCMKKCDNCCSETVSVTRDVTAHCLNIVKLVQEIQLDKVTVIHCQDVYKGSKNGKILKLGHNENPYHGGGKDLDRGAIERIFFHLQSEGCLLEYQIMKGGFASTYVKLGPNANSVIKSKNKIELQFAQASSRPLTSGSKGGARLNATGNGPGLNSFRYQDSFVSAREFRFQEQEKENIDWRASTSAKISTPRQDFGGTVNDSNNDMMEYAYNELRNLRLQKLQELGYGRPTYFIGDMLLKEMALKLPTNAKDFAKLENVTKEQIPSFQHFKKLLATLARSRKKAESQGTTQQSTTTISNSTISESASPYFRKSQAKSSQGRKRSQGKKSYSQKGYTQRKSQTTSKSTSHIRQMPI